MSDANSRWPSDPDHEPSGLRSDPELRELRGLLIGPEQKKIHELHERLSAPVSPSEEVVAAVLPAAFARASHGDQKLSSAMLPLVEGSIAESVRKRPEAIVEAIFPIIGAAISRAVRETLLRMMQQTSYAMEHAFSLRSWKWRLEARATGKPFSEVVLLHSLVYRVEQVFLIHPETGLLLQHVYADSVAPASGEETQYAAMVSSMLTAIQDFVRDSFRGQGAAALDSIDVGDLSVWIERGPSAVLAGVIRGTAPLSLRTVLRTALESCHREHHDALKRFAGNPEELGVLRPYLEACLQVQIEAKRRAPIWPWLLILLGVGAAAGYGGLRLYRHEQKRSQIESAIARLAAQPGVAVVHARSDGMRHQVFALRDPDTEPETVLLQRAGVSPQDVTVTWKSFFSGDADPVMRRVHKALRPPQGVELQFEQGVLTARGVAEAQWVAEASLVAPVVPGVRRFDCQVSAHPRPPSVQERTLAKVQRIEGMELQFRAGTSELLPGQEAVLKRAVDEILSLIELARQAHGIRPMVEVHAYTDDIGTPAYNQKLRESRASFMLSMLLAAGVPAEHLRSVLPLDLEHERRDRAAGFRIVIANRNEKGEQLP